MKKLSVDDLVRITKATSQMDKIKFAIEISDELEEFLLILQDSFDFSKVQIEDIENSLKPKTTTSDYNFVKEVAAIKNEKSGFRALLYIVKHFGFDNIEKSMKDLFDMETKPYSDIIKKFEKFSGITKEKPEPVKKEKKKPKPQPDIIPETFSFSRIYKPARTTDGSDLVAIYSFVNNKEILYGLLDSNGEKLQSIMSKEFTVVNKWSHSQKTVYARVMRMLKNKSSVAVKKEGANRIIYVI